MSENEYPYAKGYASQLIEFMAKGHAFENFVGEIRVPLRYIKKWLREHQDFRDAYEIGLAKYKIFHEKIQMAKAVGGKRGRKPKSEG